MSPDLAARQVIVSCYPLLNLSSPIICDHEYEHLVKLVVNNWDDIHPDRKRPQQDQGQPPRNHDR